VTVEVLLLGAPDCHLCEVAKALLRDLEHDLGYALREVDITGDADLEREYREQIPVVFVAGRKAFKYRVEPVELARRVSAAQAAGASTGDVRRDDNGHG
jgi:glutaredoxin